MTKQIATMTRAQLEGAIIENRMIDDSKESEIDRVLAMSDDQVRELVHNWIVAGDECKVAA